MIRYHDVRMLTSAELERTKRELHANLGLITPDSPAHVPIQAHMRAIDAELAERAGIGYGMNCDNNLEEDDMSNDAVADDRLDQVAANLMSHGLHVNIPIDKPLSPYDPDADSIGVCNPANGRYARVGYVSSGRNCGGVFLELTYQTAPDGDPDGAHIADGVVRLLSTDERV